MNTKLKEAAEKYANTLELDRYKSSHIATCLTQFATSEAVRLHWKEQFKLEQDKEIIRFYLWMCDNEWYKQSDGFFESNNTGFVISQEELLLIFRNEKA